MQNQGNPYESPSGAEPRMRTPIYDLPPLRSLRPVALGLRLVMFGLAALIVADAIVAAHELVFRSPAALAIFWRVRLLSSLGTLVAIAGVAVCLATPRDVGAGRAIRIAAGAAAAVFIMNLARYGFFVSSSSMFDFLWSRPAALVGFVLGAAMQFGFLIYLKRLAWFVRRRNLIVGSQRLLGLAIGLVGFQFWQYGFIRWLAPASLQAAESPVTEQVLEILWPLAYLYAAYLIYRLRAAILVKNTRRMRTP